MKVFAVLSATFAIAAAIAPLHDGDGSAPENDWLVIFYKDSTQAARDAHMSMIKGSTFLDASSEVKREFAFQKFFGYSAMLSAAQLAKVRADDKVVEFIEPNMIAHATMPVDKIPAPSEMNKTACTVQHGATWGLVRVGERDIRIDGEFHHDSDGGEDVDAYILDTGVYMEHTEFEGRARWGFDAINPISPETDRNGHGTHCAGTVGGAIYGVAKKANIVAVQVLGANGSGSYDQVIAGVQFTCSDHREKGNKCVANMSLGGGYSAALNRAVEEAIGCGCQYAIAAGNSNNNACLSSPASVKDAVTLSSSDNSDRRSSFSSFGDCCDAFAPGSSITSAWIGSPYAINTISGTSMAAPHACGAMANILANRPTLYPEGVKEVLIEASTKDKITDDRGTPNALVYTTC